MDSPFPGMNPYLENPVLWSGLHKRLIVGIANFLSPQLRPKYIVSIAERVYQTSEEDSLLVDIPDVVGESSQIATSPETVNIAVDTQSVKPVTVKVPVPETVRESYLQVREVATREVVTVIEVLSPIVNLQTLLSELYDRASYDLVIDYSIEPVPPLSEAQAAWADEFLREKGLR